MWWLGSLPWAYCPLRPVMSQSPMSSSGDSSVKRRSRALTNSSRPPKSCTMPFTSCGTKKRYCQGVASV